MKYYVVELTGSWYTSKDGIVLHETARDFNYKSNSFTSCEKYIDDKEYYHAKLVIVNEYGYKVEMDYHTNKVIALHPFVWASPLRWGWDD